MKRSPKAGRKKSESASTLNVPSVDSSKPTPATSPESNATIVEIGPRATWPRYEPEQRKLIEDYLTGWALHASEGLKNATAMAEIHPENEKLFRQVEYWRNVLSAIKWLFSGLTHRQRHLAVLKAQADHNGHK